MNSTLAPSRRYQTVRQLQVVAMKTAQLNVRAEALLRSSEDSVVTEGLIAVGLCKQAKEQVAAACQNLGFAVESLTNIPNNQGLVEMKLAEASTRAVDAIHEMIGVSEQAIAPGLQGFVNEMLVIAALTVARAEEHIKQGEEQ